MATPIVTDHAQAVDQSKTNRLTKNDFIKAYLAGFAKQDHRLHYSDKKMFDAKSACEVIKFYKKQPILNPIHHALMHIHELNQKQAQGGAA
jgi:2',3'-cyclic-nucleotide 2'-phosphodiesterase (5'-nucleotidase family)